MSREIHVVFSVSGYCWQTIELNDDCKLSAEEVVDGLNNGSILTTAQNGSELLLLTDASTKPLGRVNNEMECEYFDFELNGDDDEV